MTDGATILAAYTLLPFIRENKINKMIYSKYRQDKKKQCLKRDEILNYYTKRDTHTGEDNLYIININRTVVPR